MNIWRAKTKELTEWYVRYMTLEKAITERMVPTMRQTFAALRRFLGVTQVM